MTYQVVRAQLHATESAIGSATEGRSAHYGFEQYVGTHTATEAEGISYAHIDSPMRSSLAKQVIASDTNEGKKRVRFESLISHASLGFLHPNSDLSRSVEAPRRLSSTALHSPRSSSPSSNSISAHPLASLLSSLLSCRKPRTMLLSLVYSTSCCTPTVAAVAAIEGPDRAARAAEGEGVAVKEEGEGEGLTEEDGRQREKIIRLLPGRMKISTSPTSFVTFPSSRQQFHVRSRTTDSLRQLRRSHWIQGGEPSSASRTRTRSMLPSRL